MRKYVLTVLCIFWVSCCLHLNAQIGVNTDNPQALLHLHPTDVEGAERDVVVTLEGKVGIGTTIPTTRLDLRGGFRYVDGNQSEGKVLLSDTHGNANWGNRPKSPVLEVPRIDIVLSNKTFTTTPSYTGVSIKLPTGNWQVMFQVSVQATDNVYWALCESDVTYNVADKINRLAIGSGIIVADMPSSVNAVYFVSQKEVVDKTYYIWCYTNSGLASYMGSGALWALSIIK